MSSVNYYSYLKQNIPNILRAKEIKKLLGNTNFHKILFLKIITQKVLNA